VAVGCCRPVANSCGTNDNAGTSWSGRFALTARSAVFAETGQVEGTTPSSNICRATKQRYGSRLIPLFEGDPRGSARTCERHRRDCVPSGGPNGAASDMRAAQRRSRISSGCHSCTYARSERGLTRHAPVALRGAAPPVRGRGGTPRRRDVRVRFLMAHVERRGSSSTTATASVRPRSVSSSATLAKAAQRQARELVRPGERAARE
jgi:hypothetical protein